MPHDAGAALAMPGMPSLAFRHGRYEQDSDFVKPKRSFAILATVAGLHLAIFAALATLKVIAVPVPELVTMVNIMMPSPPAPKEIPVTPPKPLPTSAKVAPQPVRQVSQPEVMPVLAPAENAPVVAVETAKPTPSTVATAAVAAPPAPAAPVAQSAPRFDADYLDNPAPVYPSLSRRANEEGKVVLRVFVEANGSASQLEVRTSSGYERLDKAALAAVAKWKFVPARAGNDVIGAWVLVPIVFSLKS